jgi:hypothetical protein
MKPTLILRTLALWMIVTVPAFAQHHFTAAEAHAHIGETAMVCGEVVSTRYASSTKGHPTFLNLDKPYPARSSPSSSGRGSREVRRAGGDVPRQACEPHWEDQRVSGSSGGHRNRAEAAHGRREVDGRRVVARIVPKTCHESCRR